MTHAEHSKQASRPCEASHMTFGGRCLNCGFGEPEPVQEVEPVSISQGVCKDCGNGTLNNTLNPAFEYDYSGNPFSDEEDVLVCLRCGSSHVEVL